MVFFLSFNYTIKYKMKISKLMFCYFQIEKVTLTSQNVRFAPLAPTARNMAEKPLMDPVTLATTALGVRMCHALQNMLAVWVTSVYRAAGTKQCAQQAPTSLSLSRVIVSTVPLGLTAVLLVSCLPWHQFPPVILNKIFISRILFIKLELFLYTILFRWWCI